MRITGSVVCSGTTTDLSLEVTAQRQIVNFTPRSNSACAGSYPVATQYDAGSKLLSFTPVSNGWINNPCDYPDMPTGLAGTLSADSTYIGHGSTSGCGAFSAQSSYFYSASAAAVSAADFKMDSNNPPGGYVATTSSESSSSDAAVVGGIVGATLGVVIIVLASMVFLLRRQVKALQECSKETAGNIYSEDDDSESLSPLTPSHTATHPDTTSQMIMHGSNSKLMTELQSVADQKVKDSIATV